MKTRCSAYNHDEIEEAVEDFVRLMEDVRRISIPVWLFSKTCT